MTDTYQTIRCPACGNIMRKIFIPNYGINIDICDSGCGGLYFDAKELQMFNKGSDAGVSEINKFLDGKNFPPVNEDETRICPACAAKMVKTKIYGINVQIDTCYSCGGIFLDYGELDIIRAGVRQSTPAEVKKQNSSMNNNLSIQDFYREMQIEEAEHKTESRLFCRRGYNIIDFLFDIFH